MKKFNGLETSSRSHDAVGLIAQHMVTTCSGFLSNVYIATNGEVDKSLDLRTNLLVFRTILVLERPTVFHMVKANVYSNDPDE